MTRPIPGSGARLTPVGAATTIGVLLGVGADPTTTWNSRRVPANSSVSVAVPALPVDRSSDSMRLPAGTNAVVPTTDATAGLLLVTVTGVGVPAGAGSSRTPTVVLAARRARRLCR